MCFHCPPSHLPPPELLEAYTIAGVDAASHAGVEAAQNKGPNDVGQDEGCPPPSGDETHAPSICSLAACDHARAHVLLSKRLSSIPSCGDIVGDGCDQIHTFGVEL